MTMPAERHYSVLHGDADISRIDAGFKLELGNHIVSQKSVFHR